jgi:hypothetical protein
MNLKNSFKSIFVALLFSFQLNSSVFASDVIINGQVLSSAEKIAMENRIGTRIMPGNYISDGDCWVNLSNGTSGCLSSATVNTYSRYGSGERSSNGSWNHWSNAAGGAVGGSSDGCVYTSFGWSSC